MKIDFLVSDGSPVGVTSKTVWGDKTQIGVGGAELALITICEELSRRGHDITLYNNPREADASPFKQRMIAEFHPEFKRDVLVVFRSPNVRSVPAKGYKVWWSCDQYTIGNFERFSKTVNKIVTISPFHAKYFESTYRITNTVVTDLPVRPDPVEKQTRIKNRLLFSTVPNRGLDVLWRMWPHIKKEIPDASLVITSDYRLWGDYGPLNQRHRVRWSVRKDVEFLGAVPRQRLLEEQQKSSLMLYHSEYDELFCIAVAEAQAAGIYTITNTRGALQTTNMGTTLGWEDAGNPQGDHLFVDALVKIAYDPNLENMRKELQKKARERFSLKSIVDFWEENILDENSSNHRS